MPITDPSLPIRFLDVLEATGLGFVVLHREAEIGKDSLGSDLDLAVEVRADDVVRRTAGALKEVGLLPVIRWPYDIGGAVTFFLSTETGDHGIQVDLLHDPRGRGRYGLRTGELLKRAMMGKRYPVPDPLDERLYLVHKRWCKGETSALGLELEALHDEGDIKDAHDRVQDLFALQAAGSLQLLLDGRSPKPSGAMSRLRQLPRQLGRAVSPIGYWVEIVGPKSEAQKLTESLRSRFEGWVIHLSTGERPSGLAAYRWWARQVMPIRLRPGVFLSYSESRSRPVADLTIEWHPNLTAKETTRSIVEAMSGRIPRD